MSAGVAEALGIKTCRKCGSTKVFSDFNKDIKEIDGLSRQCKMCRKAQRKASSDNRVPFLVEGKECPRCKIWKDTSGYYEQKGTKDGISPWCQECGREASRNSARRKAKRAPSFVVPFEKECTGCFQTKAASEFTISRHNNTGLKSRCRMCEKVQRASPEFKAASEDYRSKNKDRIYAVCRAWRQSPRGQEYKLKDKCIEKGLTVEWYWATFQAQDGKCAICLKPESAVFRGKVKELSIDHNHTTGDGRGLLCGRCNTALGLLQEDVSAMASMIDYVVRSTSKNPKPEAPQ